MTSNSQSKQDSFLELSVKDLQTKRFHNNKTEKPLRLQVSKPPKNSAKIKPLHIQIHFKWALILTILCFFIIGPCWALYKTFELRRMIRRNELETATCLSRKITVVLTVSTFIGLFMWIAILFCSVGLLLTGALLKSGLI